MARELHTRQGNGAARLCAMRAVVWWLGALLMLGGLPASRAAETWQVVQAVENFRAADEVARHFVRLLPQYLGEPVQLHAGTRGQEVKAVAWVTSQAPRQRTVVLMSALLLGRLDQQAPDQHAYSALLPLQMVFEGSWCLRMPAGQQVHDSYSLKTWLEGLPHPVRIGMPADHGLLHLWVQAMERKTGKSWQPQVFSASGTAMRTLGQGGLDLVLDRCVDGDDSLQPAELADALRKTVLLAREGAGMDASVKTFAQWKLPPLALGWLAWFVSGDMDVQRQQQLAAALYKVLLREDTQQLILSMQRKPVNRTPQESMERVYQLQREWRQLMVWLNSIQEPDQMAVQRGPRTP